jgi:hypothetical protein
LQFFIVNRARNLPDKGKAGGRQQQKKNEIFFFLNLIFQIGIDAFCTISLGKEKFVTAVVEKTTSPEWHEQCDM